MALDTAALCDTSRVSDSTAERFHREVRDRAESALAVAPHREHILCAGGRPVRLRFAGPCLENLLMPALEHLSTAPAGPAALTVTLFDTASTGISPPPPPWQAAQQGPRGVIAGYNSVRFRTVYQPGADVLLIYDSDERCGVYWSPDYRRVPYWEASFPLRSLFQWWLEDQPLQLAHAAAVGLPEGGVLIAGPSGSGKSTTALACLESDLLYAGDDHVLLGTSPLWAHCLYNTAKLTPDVEPWFPQLAAAISNRERCGSEKALLFLSRCAPEKLIAGFPIRALLVPRVTGLRETRLVRCSASEAFRALAPTTLFQLPGTGRRALDKLATVVRDAPVYRLELGTDLPGIPRTILRLLRTGEAA
ncbi:MAG: hypothetical protein U0Q18_36225 [Bryobacteraceae bacterium]